MKGGCPLEYKLQTLNAAGAMIDLAGAGFWFEEYIAVDASTGALTFKQITTNERDIEGVDYQVVATIAGEDIVGTDAFTVTYRPDCSSEEIQFDSAEAIADFTYTIGGPAQHHEVKQFISRYPKACPVHHVLEVEVDGVWQDFSDHPILRVLLSFDTSTLVVKIEQ
jgi:hypothetical protein